MTWLDAFMCIFVFTLKVINTLALRSVGALARPFNETWSWVIINLKYVPLVGDFQVTRATLTVSKHVLSELYEPGMAVQSTSLCFVPQRINPNIYI